MRRRSSADPQRTSDVRRAESRVAVARGLTIHQGATVLRARAGELGVSLHAAALAVLAAKPVDDALRGGRQRSGWDRGDRR